MHGEFLYYLEIAGLVLANFFSPELWTCLWKAVQVAIMSVPKASIDEHNCPVLLQHDIRAAGKTSSTQSIAKSTCVKLLAHKELQFRIGTPDP